MPSRSPTFDACRPATSQPDHTFCAGLYSLTTLVNSDPSPTQLVNELIVECPHHAAGCPKTKLRRDTLETHLEGECMHAPTTCQIPGCNTILPLAEMFEHQEMHRIQLQIETDDTSNDLDPFRDDHDSPEESRTERLTQLVRNWSVLRNRSHANLREQARAPAESPVPSVRTTSRTHQRERDLPPLPPSPEISSDLPFFGTDIQFCFNPLLTALKSQSEP